MSVCAGAFNVRDQFRKEGNVRMRRKNSLTTQNPESPKPETRVNETAKKVFVEPEITGPVDVLETTAFFQLTTGNSDVPPDLS